MRISYKGDYALKAMLDLALHYDSDFISSQDMAARIDAPVKFLEQVLLSLRKGGFIKSRRGSIGGYKLSRPPSEITVGEVARFIDGPLETIACVKEKYKGCAEARCCVLRKLWQRVDLATSTIVDKVDFESLAQEAGLNNQAFSYSI